MIDFRCEQCGRLLRTPDDAAGKQAQCPSCGAVQPIPAASDPSAAERAPEERSPTPAAPAPSAANPYAGSTYDVGQMSAVAAGAISPQRIDAGHVLTRAWAIARPQIVWLFLFGLTFIVLSYVIGAVFSGGGQAIMFGLGLQRSVVDMAQQVFTQLISQFISLFLTIGAIIYSLNVARGQAASIGDLFGGFRFLLRAVGVTILIYLILLGIVLICALPAGIAALATRFDSPATIGLLILGGIAGGVAAMVLFLTYGPAVYLVVDRDAGVFEAMSVSRRITAGNRLVLLMIYVIVVLLSIVAVCAFCFPYFFMIGFAFLIGAVAYLDMTGQTTAADVPAVNPFAPQGIPPG